MTSFSHSAFTGLIGAAREDITPPVGIYARNWGASNHDQANGVHRPLTLTALTLQSESDGEPLVLLAMDGPWWKNAEDEWLVRGGVLDALSLDASRLMLNLSHTHAGCSLSREDRDKPGGDMIEPYLLTVRDAAVRATNRALESRADATLTWGRGSCGLAHNRMFFDEAKQRIFCGFNPSGKADQSLLVGRVTGKSGKVLATLVNYACHPTTLAWQNHLLSPDFAGAMRETLEKQFPGAPCLYLHGAAGELAPREQYTGDIKIADAHGRELGYCALAVMEGMLPPQTGLRYIGPVESGAPLAVWERTPHEVSHTLSAVCISASLPLRNMHTLEEIDELLETCTDRLSAEKLRRERETRRVVGNKQATQLPVWVWRVGDGFFVGHPEEAFSLLQTEVRQRFPSHAIAVMNLVNGGAGAYLPPRNLYGLDVYEVNQTPFESGGLERLVDAACAGVEQLRRLT